MTLLEIVIFIVSAVGAIVAGRKRKYTAMFACIVVATAMFILLLLTLILVMGID